MDSLRGMRLIATSILAVLGLCLPSIAMPAETVFRAKVLEIVSADMIVLKKGNGETVTVKLSGIDCPKTGQSHFIRARLFASQRILGQEVIVKLETGSSESAQPPPATISYDEGGSQRSLNSELLEAGMARRSVSPSATNLTTEELEAEARKLRRGLWADPNLPSTFRVPPIK